MTVGIPPATGAPGTDGGSDGTQAHGVAVGVGGGVEAGALLDARDARDALSAAYAFLDAERDGRRVLVATIDAGGSIQAAAPPRASRSWALPILGAVDATGPCAAAWTAVVPTIEDLRAVVVIDDPDPPARLADRGLLAATAIARAVAVERDRSRADEMRRLVSTAKGVALSLELDTLLQEIVRDAATLIGADSGDMLLLDPDAGMLSVVAVTNFPPEMLGLEFPFGQGLSTQAMRSGQPLIVSDYLHYEHRIPSIDHYDLRSVLCAPLVVRDRAIGALNVHGIHAPRAFTSHDADLLAAFADLAAIAIDHARRYENEQRLARQLAGANEELTSVLTLQRRLSDQVVSDVGIEAMVDELAGRLDRPLVLYDGLGRLVAGASPDGSDGWQSLAGPRRQRAGGPRPGRTLEAALDEQPLPPGGAARAWPVRVGSDTVAHLVAGAGGAANEALVETACTGLALEFAKRLARIEVERRLRGDALMDLLSGDFTSEAAILARMAHLGHDIAEPHDVLIVDIDDFHRLSEEHGETTAVRLKRRFFDVVHAEVLGRAPGSLVAAQSDSVIVLLTVGPSGRLTPETLAVNLQQLVASALPGVTISVGIGDRATRPQDYAPAYRVARESLDLMHRLGRRAVVMGAGQLGAYRVLLKTSSPDELRAYARRTLGPLLDPERRGSAELLTTLRVFLDSGQSQRATARTCSVHVNTIVYRLARISDLLGVDLSDPSVVFDLTLAFRIADVAGLDGPATS